MDRSRGASKENLKMKSVVDFDLEEMDLVDFIYEEEGEVPPLVKPKKTIPDKDGGADIVREEKS